MPRARHTALRTEEEVDEYDFDNVAAARRKRRSKNGKTRKGAAAVGARCSNAHPEGTRPRCCLGTNEPLAHSAYTQSVYLDPAQGGL